MPIVTAATTATAGPQREICAQIGKTCPIVCYVMLLLQIGCLALYEHPALCVAPTDWIPKCV